MGLNIHHQCPENHTRGNSADSNICASHGQFSHRNPSQDANVHGFSEPAFGPRSAVNFGTPIHASGYWEPEYDPYMPTLEASHWDNILPSVSSIGPSSGSANPNIASYFSSSPTPSYLYLPQYGMYVLIRSRRSILLI